MLQRLVAGVATAAVAALALVGCTPEEPAETTPPATTAAPTNAASRDIESLATETRAAWDAYRARLSELGAAPETASLESLEEVATHDMAVALLGNFEDAVDRRIRTAGERVTTAFALSDTEDAPHSLTANVCVDLSQERYVGDEGVDLTPADRPNERASVVVFTSDTSEGRYLVASERELVRDAGEDPCDG